MAPKMPTTQHSDVLAALKDEIRKYCDGELNDDMAVDELHILDDDLTAIALALEKKLRFRLDRKTYWEIKTIADWARLIHAQSNDR
jgi:hypothetical protein